MLHIQNLDPAEAVTVISGEVRGGLSRKRWKRFCKKGGLVAFTANEKDIPVGFCLVSSEPPMVQIIALEGDPKACQLLFERVVRLAGERNVSVWFPTCRKDLGSLAEAFGFVWQRKVICEGVPCHCYLLDRNEGALTA